MTLRKKAPLAKQRWLVLVTGVIAALALSVGAVLAIHGAGTEPDIFELDGNAQDETPAAPPNPDGTLPDDWDSVLIGTPPASSNFLDVSFVQQSTEGPATDSTYYFGGATKDDIDIDTVAGTPGSGGWQRDATSGTQPKAEILNAYAAAYKVDSDASAATLDDTVIYFGMDRFSNDGATFGGFWFLQSPITFGSTANNGVGEIHGNHVIGDILVITDFTQGGAVANFKVYRWVGTGGDVTSGTLDELYTGTDCKLAPADTTLACSTVNADEETAPWPFTPKANVGPAGTFQPGLFVEGGINISQLLPGDGDPCFSTFVAETRASFSVDSTLSDFATDSFNTCGEIEATKYHDRDANGSRDADGPDNDANTTADNEGPLAGWTIFIDENANETLDAGEQSAVTIAGTATFEDLPAGTYSVCEVLDNGAGDPHEGWFNSDPAGITLCESVSVGIGGATATVDFGNYQNGTKSGFKYEDEDANTDFDSGTESKLSGWPIKAFLDVNGDGEFDAADSGADASTTTDGSGNYSLSLTPGKYFVCEDAQPPAPLPTSGWTQSSPASGDTGYTAECGDTDAPAGLAGAGYYITVTSQSTDTNNEFGNNRLFRLIILTCSETTGQLIVSTVDLDGNPATTGDQTDTTTTNPAGVNLCDTGGARYEDLPAGTYNPQVVIPKP